MFWKYTCFSSLIKRTFESLQLLFNTEYWQCLIRLQICVQECFNSPYGTQYFPEYKESVPGPTTKSLAEIAKECNVYLIGGENYGFILFKNSNYFKQSNKSDPKLTL